jgi:AraC family transcriptional regulator of adaptative response/methylated-DNA-[protein]-cysteine methyltransferase
MKIEDADLRREFYRAMVNRDESYRGVFITGVKTTGIFCLPVCSARKPKEENCEFFDDVRDALRHGYRPCKICRPTEGGPEVPPAVRRAQTLLADPEREGRLTDDALRREGVSPEAVRRWYKRQYGITFQAYQRMLRVNRAFTEIRDASRVSDAAMNAGYDSLSGFAYTYRKLARSVPSDAPRGDLIVMDRIETPIGLMFAAAVTRGLCLLEFTDRRMLETELEDLQKRLGAGIVYGRNAHIERCETQLKEYFAGRRRSFDLELVTPAGEFRLKVWRALADIPYGSTASYRDIAVAVGSPGAVRAVGSANGHNRLAIVIPCHRVIGSDGSLTGYGGGLDRKRWLLDHEMKHRPA